MAEISGAGEVVKGRDLPGLSEKCKPRRTLKIRMKSSC